MMNSVRLQQTSLIKMSSLRPALLLIVFLTLTVNTILGDGVCPEKPAGATKWSCNETDFICHNANLDSTDILKSYTENHPNVMHIEFVGNRLGYVSNNTLRECAYDSTRQLKSLVHLDLSNNAITGISGKAIHCIPNLETLILDDNEWNITAHHERTFSQVPRLTTLSMKNTIKEWYGTHARFVRNLGDIFMGSNMFMLQHLNMAENELMKFPSDILAPLTSLKSLNFSGNLIGVNDVYSVNLSSIDISKWVTLDLRNNVIKYLDKTFWGAVENSTLLVNLDNNPFRCDCDFIDSGFYDWLISTTRVSNVKKLECNTPAELAGKKIIDKTIKDKMVCSPPENLDNKLQGSYIALGVILGLLALLSIGVGYLNREKIKYKVRKILRPFTAAMSQESHQGYAAVNNPAV